MKILIWGAGAIGGTIGAYLAGVGHEIALVDVVADHVEAINKSGLSIVGPIDEFTVNVPAFTPGTLSGEYEVILLCVKAQHTESAAQALAPHLSADGYVVSVQNGLNEFVIADIVGRERTVGSFVNFGGDYMEPGVIHFGGRGAVVLGELDGEETARVQALHKTFLDYEPNAIVTENIWGYLWGKLAYGAMLFATALTNESIADALADPAYRDLYIQLGQEVLAVAVANDITPEAFNGFNPHAFVPGVEPSVSEESMAEMVAFNRRSAKTHSGIWRDLAVRKRRTEVDPQLRPIVTFGEEAGVPAPITAQLIELIHDIEEGRRTQSTDNLDILQAELT